MSASGRIDLNADIGEGYDDGPLLDIVTTANIACGAHAGDAFTMRRAVEAARARSIAIGAHPGYPDRESMGRTSMNLTPEQVARTLRAQVDLLIGIAGSITHVKPHGALYNQMATNKDLARAVADAVATYGVPLVGLAGTRCDIAEGFADRRYMADGSLAPRSRADAMIDDPDVAAEQALAIALGWPVETLDGEPIVVTADTICIHGDSPSAVVIARAVRAALEAAGVFVAAITPT